MAEELTEKQSEELIREFNEGKQNMHSFFTKIVKALDTTKTGNLSIEELGYSKLPVRTYKELELFSEDVADEKAWAEYFRKMSEIQTSTSLSKDALLIKLAVTIKKELSDMTPQNKKENRGWFKSRPQQPQP